MVQTSRRLQLLAWNRTRKTLRTVLMTGLLCLICRKNEYMMWKDRLFVMNDRSFFRFNRLVSIYARNYESFVNLWNLPPESAKIQTD